MKIFAYSVREDEIPYFKAFSEEHSCEINYTTEYPSMDNLALAAGHEGISVITNVITGEMYDEWHKHGVKYIATRSVGFDHLDTARMKALGMRGVHASYSPNAVANFAIMLMLMACRKVTYILDKANVQDFSLTGKVGREISVSTVGIIGAGAIGETVAKHLSGFGCRILVHSNHENKNLAGIAEHVDLDTLFRESDIITLHVPGSERNRHLICRETIAKMKDGVILVNTARGTVVDSEALIEALESGKIGFAALDTFEEEPGLYYKDLDRTQISNRTLAILKSFPNVILTPHMAFYTAQSTADMVGSTNMGLLNFEKDGPNPAEISYNT